MATTYKVLGQVAPSATTVTTLYTVPGSTTTICSTVRACNRGGSADAFRIAVVPSGDSIEAKHYQIYDLPIAPNDSFSLTEGWTLATGDKIQVYAGTGNMSFTAFGKETT
jgi:hypothetical protein